VYLASLRGQSVAFRTREHIQPYKRKTARPAANVFEMNFSRLCVGFEVLLRLSEMGAVSSKICSAVSLGGVLMLFGW
jgi:hypothetical protein